jgi:hypothetical protein
MQFEEDDSKKQVKFSENLIAGPSKPKESALKKATPIIKS